MSKLVKDIMMTKVITINPFDSVQKAENIMYTYKIGGLPVIEDNQLLGIITSLDIRRSHPNRLVIDAMTKNPISIQEDRTLWEAKNLLEKYNIERLPVVSCEKKLIGIITKGILYKELAKYFDVLTGLAAPDLLLDSLVDTSLSKNQDIVILFLDINNFGIFNKNYGHVIGDKVLKEISQILLNNINSENLCRYGGDEFTAILYTSIEEAKLLANKIILEISNSDALKSLSVSVSIGIAGGRRKNLDFQREELIKNIKNLINLASLASTKAKTLNLNFAVADTLQLSS